MGSLGDRIRTERARRFVGREAERAAFRAMLDGNSATVVLWLHGPGGVGKTTLLAQLRDDAELAGRRTISLDARDLEATASGVLAAIAGRIDVELAALPEALGREPCVVFLDTYEQFALDTWMRDALLPSLPDGVLLVIAGREPPLGWRLDPGLAGLVTSFGLRNLDPITARELLVQRGVTTGLDALVTATHGHPLALALVSELSAAADFELADAPDVVQRLLDRLVDRVPGELHRDALWLAAHVQVTSDELLRVVFGARYVPDLFDWLREQPYMQLGPRGLFPHDLARDVIEAASRLRDPEGVRTLKRAATRYLVDKITKSPERAVRDLTTMEWLYLARDLPMMQAVVDFSRLGTVASEEPHGSVDEAFDIVATLGPTTLACARAWYELLPQSLRVYRDPDGTVSAVTVTLVLDEGSLRHGATFDPVIAACLAHVDSHGALRRGDTINVRRTLAIRDRMTTHPARNEFQARAAADWLSQPQLVWSFQPHRANTRWAAIMRFADHHPIDQKVTIDGIEQVVFAHDWRASPRDVWLETVIDRVIVPGAISQPPRRQAPLVALSEPEFREAVKHALKHYARGASLATNRLVQSRVVRDSELGGEEGLRALLRAAVDAIRSDRRADKLVQVLDATYIDPADTQELAAERLGLPWSTYRRHLTSAVDRVVDWLWQREVGA